MKEKKNLPREIKERNAFTFDTISGGLQLIRSSSSFPQT
jgi:hypothetical protein